MDLDAVQVGRLGAVGAWIGRGRLCGQAVWGWIAPLGSRDPVLACRRRAGDASLLPRPGVAAAFDWVAGTGGTRAGRQEHQNSDNQNSST